MAIASTIPSVVTMGFGNGTYAPNVGLLVTLGYCVVDVADVSRTWPISKPRSGRTWEPEGDSRTWGVPVDKTRNV